MTTWTRLARVRLGVLVLGAALAVAGCDAAAEPGPTARGTEAAVAGETYVALGDSYTAAPINPMTSTPDGCLRSKHNYPSLVASALHLDVTDVSCSGASTISMFSDQAFATQKMPPQLDALSPTTDIVTLGIGANDFQYFTHMMFDCLSVAKRDPKGDPCETKNDKNGTDKLERRLGAIRHQVARVVRAIKQRAPKAKVIMVGYPSLLPASGHCRAKLPLAVGDYPYTRQLNMKLVEAVKDGSTSAGAEYVDVASASVGHDICSADPWVAGIRGDHGRAMGLHPYPAEQRAVADMIEHLLA